MNIIDSFDTSQQASTSLEPKLVLIIECKADNSNANNNTASSLLKRVRGSKERKDELVHFDLYTKTGSKFIKRLTSYSRDEDSNNLSLKIDLDPDFVRPSSSSVENIGDQHVVVMSTTDSNNRPKRANVTLFLNNNNANANLIANRQTNTPLFQSPPESDQGFSRTADFDSPISGKSLNMTNNNNQLASQ